MTTSIGSRVVMLVQNDWRTDTRVIREARALAELGLDVHVICRRVTSEETTEPHGGVTFHVVPVSDPPRAREIARLFDLHARVLGLSGDGTMRPRRRIGGMVPPALLAALPAAIPLLILQAIDGRMSRSVLGSHQARLMHDVGMKLQPYRYLNDFALKCLRRVVALRPDVIHAHDLVTLSAGALAAAETGARLVYDAHELETHTNYELALATKRLLARYEPILAQRADRVVTVCESIADWLASHYGIDRPVVVMNSPAGGAFEGPPDPAAGVRGHLNLGESVPLIVYVGSVTIDRGLERCVEALALLPGVHLATVGPRYERTEAAMVDRADALAVGDRVHFVDARPADEIVEFIASADCSVMAIQNVCLSYYYCFPNKLLESVLAGLPVVVADLFELRRFVGDTGVGVVVDESSASSIADGIAQALSAHELRPSASVRQDVAARFGWHEQRRKLYALYDELLPSSRKVSATCAG